MIAKSLMSLMRNMHQQCHMVRYPPNHFLNLNYSVREYYSVSNKDNAQVQLLEEVEGKIFQVIKSTPNYNSKNLSRTATFQQLGFDSLGSVELVVAMEQYMGIQIDNQQAIKISTVEAAINTFFRYLNAKLANKIQTKP